MTKRTFPIFFSVASADIDFAEKVWEHFPSDWIYLYSKSGEESAHMWEEISERELPQSKVVVVFWSRNYLKAKGCIREIKQTSNLLKSKIIRPLVLRIDDCPLHWNENFPDEAKEIFADFGSTLEYRTSPECVSTSKAIELVNRVSDPILVSDHPRLPRPELIRSMRSSLQLPNDKFRFAPAAWISGFNGVGRETLVREYCRDFVPNGTGIHIELNEASVPKQLLLRIESEALGASLQRLDEIQETIFESETIAVANAIERVVNSGNYLILRQGRIVEEQIELPEWLDDVINALEPSTRSKIFIISQVPLQPMRRIRCQKGIGSQRVSTITDNIMQEYCYQLVGHFDPHPQRWTDDVVDQLVSAAGGNIGFLVSLVRTASRIEDFDQLDALIAAEGASIVEQITVYIRWAFGQLANFPDEQRTLIFLNEVSPCDLADLERVIMPTRAMLRVLGKLLELGLVERDSDNLYRLTPLFSRRLERDLIRPDLLEWGQRALAKFVKEPVNFETPDHEFLRIESRIQAAMISGGTQLPEGVARFVSAAHWFQAGIRLYHANRHDAAYRLLKKAFERRGEFSQSSRIEIIRYYCLSATRFRKYPESEGCIKLLEGDHRTKAMAAFLRGNLHELKGEFFDAIEWYEKALSLNEGKDRRLEHTYRPLIACILRTPKPDFDKAETYALSYVKLRRTEFSLMSLARVYLGWKYRSNVSGRTAPQNIDKLYSDALEALANHPGVYSTHFEVRAEEAEFEGDFAGALRYMDQAVTADPRPLLRSERWRLMARSGSQPVAEQALSEMDQAKADADVMGNWGFLLPTLVETYVRALRVAGKPVGRVNSFAAGMPDADIGRIIYKVNKGRNTA